MATKSGFFNSINRDRVYDANFFAEYFASFIGNGVFPNPSTGLQVLEKQNMTLTIKPGKAWINGYYFANDSDYVISLANADGTLNRIDRIVLRLNYTNREVVFAVKKGAFASSPVAPTLQRDADAYELGLADIYVTKGATSIVQAKITDLRLNSQYCGIVAGVVQQIDVSSVFNQYQSWFESFSTEKSSEFLAWVQSIEGLLDENTSAQFYQHLADYVKHPAIVATTNSGNNYSVTLDPPISSYLDGMGLVLKINASSNAATTINVNNLGAKPIFKSSGNTVKDLYKGGIYTLRYSSTANNGAGGFILQGEGGEYGTATSSDVLAGKTIGTDDGIFNGTIPNNGAGGTVTPSTITQTKPAGYYSSDITIPGANTLIPGNIRKGISMFGITGTLDGKRYSKGTNIASSGKLTVTGLSFIPEIIIMTSTSGSTNYARMFVASSLGIYPFVITNTTYQVFDIVSGNVNYLPDTSLSVTSNGFSATSLSNANGSWTWLAIE